jgi:FkbM family methyltransferase
MAVEVGRPAPPIRRRVVRALFERPLEMIVPRRMRVRIGRKILDRGNGDNDDSDSNGEAYVTEHVKRRLKGKPVVVLDIGANVGEWSLQFGHGMTEDLTIYCFEPSPRNHEYLQRNIDYAHGRPSFRPVNAAVGNADGTAVLHLTEGDTSGSNSLYERHGENFKTVDTVEVPVVTADSFCAQHGIDSLAFVKIDTEGSEMAVLTGMMNLMRQRKVACIQFEYSTGWIDSRRFLMEAFEMLLPLGYRIGKIFPTGILYIPAYDPHLETYQLANYLAVQPEWAEVFPVIH